MTFSKSEALLAYWAQADYHKPIPLVIYGQHAVDDRGEGLRGKV